MANEIRVSTSVTPIKEVDVTEGGNTYDLSSVDTNAGRSWGGYYNTLTAYTDDDICRWTGAVISQTAYTNALSASAWTEASDVTDGTIPATVYAIAVEYTNELGTVGDVTIRLTLTTETIEIAELDLGEGVAIPLHAGVTPAKIHIKAGAYTNGTNEATVNVLLVGV